MEPQPLPYEEYLGKIMDDLKSKNLGVLATSEGNRVTAREMVYVCNGKSFTFVTTIHTRKYHQIEANNQVALSVGNVQIEGVAKIKGHPSKIENRWFVEALPEQAKKLWYDLFLDPTRPETIIELAPKRMALYFGAPDAHFDVLLMDEQKALRYESLDRLISYE